MRINEPIELIGAQPVGSYGDATSLERRIKRLPTAEKAALAVSFGPYTPPSQEIL